MSGQGKALEVWLDTMNTPIGRLLLGSKAVVDDQLAAMAKNPAQDGLPGITLDVAHRFFATGPRSTQPVATNAPPAVADQFEARLLWMSPHALAPGRQYLMQHTSTELGATITSLRYRLDVGSDAHLAAKKLELNEMAVVNLSTSAPLAFEPHAINPTLGGFVLVDKLTRETVGVGMIDFALRRASNIHWQALEINKAARAAQKQQTPRCIWFTGLSGSGKSTLANLLDQRLYAQGCHTYVLDGDNVRHGLNRNLGFTEADRVENIRRVAEVARLMVDAGLIVLVSFISPFAAERAMARSLFAPGEFVEVFVDTPLEECERRDVKGLYAKARRGELKNFTGIDSPYEAPANPDVQLPTASWSLEQCVDHLIGFVDSGEKCFGVNESS